MDATGAPLNAGIDQSRSVLLYFHSDKRGIDVNHHQSYSTEEVPAEILLLIASTQPARPTHIGICRRVWSGTIME